ncbi:MAG: DUF1648 domain-containing protein [Anaerolineales bacterium]|nr:DUF1648 domain-containing protein [Anaerolineales bacterium]
MNLPVPPPPPEILAPREEIVAEPQAARLALLARDHALQILFALAVLSNLALFAYLGIRFDALPDPLPLHFDATGLADRIEAKNGIFGLPIIGALVLALNCALGIPAHRRERAATILLVTGALLTQILLWFAVSSIVGGLV